MPSNLSPAFAGEHQRRGQFPRRSGGHTRQDPTVGFFKRHQSPLSHLALVYPRQVLPSPTAWASNVPQASRRRIATAISRPTAVLLFADFQGCEHVMTVPIRIPGGNPGTIGTTECPGRYLAAISSRVRRSSAPFVTVLGREEAGNSASTGHSSFLPLSNSGYDAINSAPLPR